MKMLKINGTDIEVKAHNQREEHLLRIVNMRLATMSEEYCYEHMIDDLQGLLSAMFFLGMTTDPMAVSGYGKRLNIRYKGQTVSLPMADVA